MILVSNDRFFVNGIQLLASEYRSLNDPELMILDFSSFIYIINAKWYYRQRFESPLTALQYCNKFLYLKSIKLNTFLKVVNANKKKNNVFLLRNITTTELTIIKSICNGVAQNVIAGQLSRSIKTINAHKMRALYKLGVDDIRTFYHLLNLWECLWPTLRPTD